MCCAVFYIRVQLESNFMRVQTVDSSVGTRFITGTVNVNTNDVNLRLNIKPLLILDPLHKETDRYRH